MEVVSTATGAAPATAESESCTHERSTIAATGSLAKHDIDGDGRIDKSEITTMARISALYKAAAVLLAILTVIFAACTFGLSFAAVELSKDTHVVKTALSDGANSLIGTKAVTAMFSLPAAAAMSDDRLAKVKSLHVSFVLGGKLPSFLSEFEGVPNIPKYGLLKKIHSVVSAARLGDTTVVFATGEYGHKLMISDGIATMHVNGGGATETYIVCTSTVECGAVYADSAEEVKELNDKAMAALPPAQSRPLSDDDECIDPAATSNYASMSTSTCGDGETTVCSQVKVIFDTCKDAGTPTDACFEAELCAKDYIDFICKLWTDEHCNASRRELSAEMEDHPTECADTPDDLIAEEAGQLGLIAESCADLLFLGACELEMVEDLCGKTCGACGDEQGGVGHKRSLKSASGCG